MKLKNFILFSIASTFFLTSCISKKVLKAEQDRYIVLQGEQAKLTEELKNCTDLTAENSRKKAALESEIEGLKKQVDYLKENNNQALKQLENLSVISGSQAESIKKSLDNIGSKDAYIQGL